jgi:predicted ribosome quality control (RQC) complex YloA/Tae2 family protein
MINNYYTLREIVREAEFYIRGEQIVECYTQERNRLVLTNSGKETKSLIISCEPRQNFLYIRDAVHRARKNTFDTLTNIRGKRITDIELHPSDRHIKITLADETYVVIQLFGVRSNVYAVDREYQIRDAFLHPKEVIDTRLGSPKIIPDPPRTYEEFIGTLFSDNNQTIKQSLKQHLVLFGTVLHKELIVRSGLDSETETGTIPLDSRTRLWNSYVEITEELNKPSPRIYYDESTPVEMGLIHLMQHYGKPERPFQSCSDAVRTFVNVSHKKKTAESSKKEIHTRLSSELKKAERAVEAINKELTEGDRSAAYEHLGKLLLSYPNEDTKGKQTIELQDISDAGTVITVPVDPRLTTVQNAQHYFERARKARQARREAERRVVSVDKRLLGLQMMLNELESIEDTGELTTFFRTHQKTLSSIGIRMSKESKEELPFRVFRVAGDFEVWTGKSSANNDLLTMKYAKPNDLWFHARGASGSHVVLKTGGSKDTVPKEAILQAASIAAYYSKMKTSKLVPVAMTDRKFVRKRKGDPPGTVILSREKVILVEPKLPVADAAGD